MDGEALGHISAEDFSSPCIRFCTQLAWWPCKTSCHNLGEMSDQMIHLRGVLRIFYIDLCSCFKEQSSFFTVNCGLSMLLTSPKGQITLSKFTKSNCREQPSSPKRAALAQKPFHTTAELQVLGMLLALQMHVWHRLSSCCPLD